MKKFFVSLVTLLSVSVASVFAQSSLIATLSHEGEVTAFYGGSALSDAHKAAVHGDAITLSSGSFTATNITKAITLRGAGMQLDTVNNVLPTTIIGDFDIHIPDTTTKKLTVEGIYHNHDITVEGTLNGARFIKNRFNVFKTYSNLKDCLVNSTFLHCKIEGHFQLWYNSDVTFSNCYITQLGTHHSTAQMQNCVINYASGSYISNQSNMSLYNCILIGRNGSTDYLSSSCVAYNCVAVNCGENKCFENIPNTTNKHSTFSDVFENFTGTYSDNVTFALTDEAKRKFLGTDGTQVGIYGGNFPYDPTTSNPQITKCNVAAKSTADGKLSVDIEVNGVE